MTNAWPARLSSAASSYLADLAPPVQELVRDVLDIACRTPYGWPQFDPSDPEGRDLRWAALGMLTVVYWVNRSQRHLYVLDIQWARE